MMSCMDCPDLIAEDALREVRMAESRTVTRQALKGDPHGSSGDEGSSWCTVHWACSVHVTIGSQGVIGARGLIGV